MIENFNDNENVMINITNKTKRTLGSNEKLIDFNSKLFNEQNLDELYVFNIDKLIYLSFRSSEPSINFIKPNPDKKKLLSLWKLNEPKSRSELLSSIMNSLTELNLIDKLGVSKKELQESIGKMYDTVKNKEGISKLLNDQLSNKENQNRVINSIAGSGMSGACSKLPPWKELKSYKEVEGFWNKIGLTLDYNTWIWKKISCNLKPWVCPLFPIFCLEEYIYELSDKNIFWKIFSWIVFIIVEFIDIVLIILGTVLDFFVPGGSLWADILSIIYSFLRFDPLGVIFGTIGLIPYIGSILPVANKALRTVLRFAENLIGKGINILRKQKLGKVTIKLISHSTKLISIIKKADVLLGLIKIGQTVGKVSKSPKTVANIILKIFSNSEQIIKLIITLSSTVMNKVEKAKEIGLLTKDTPDEIIEFARQVAKSLSAEEIKATLIFLSENAKGDIKKYSSTLIEFGAKYGTLAKDTVNIIINLSKTKINFSKFDFLKSKDIKKLDNKIVKLENSVN